jgi:hypothetical protein
VHTIGAAVTRAVDAATAADRDAYEDAAATVVALPAGMTGILLATVARTLIEEQHPDGLDSDDIQVVLGRCYRGGAGFLGDAIDVRVLIAVLASALGIHEAGLTYQEMNPVSAVTDDWPPALDEPAPDERVTGRPPSPAEFAWHAPLVIADLLTAGHRRLAPYLDEAFADIATAEAMELP